VSEINAAIVRAALGAKTPEEATDLQASIEMSIGGEHFRPLGDKWGNFGILASAADYDLKLVELITNMQDASIERAALAKYGDRAGANAALHSPREAVTSLFGVAGPKDLPEVTFWESDPPASKSHKLTVWFDDRGTGMTPASIPETIFALGGSSKEDARYLQGAFGLGGELMYRNSDYVVLVSRRAPELLAPGEPDRISVAVVQWNDQYKTQTAAYLVDQEWARPGDVALPWSCPAEDFPEFEAGTHIGLISYGTAGLYRQREGDDRSFDTIVNTRLFDPMFSTRWRNHLARGDQRATTMRGLRTRLESTSHDFPIETDQMPFVYEGQQYFLTVRYVVFAAKDTPGERRKFVARDHAVLFTSNGQVQTHWTPAEFKQKTKLKKLDTRVLVEVDLDALPVDGRTSLVTPDRAQTVKSNLARRLEEEVVSFLNDWDSLVEQNYAILQEQLRSTTEVNTRGVSDQIRRAFNAKGFGASAGTAAANGPGGDWRSGGTRRGKPRPPIALLDDPTQITGPKSLTMEVGRTRSQRFTVNARDDFFVHERGTLTIEAGAGFPFETVTDFVSVGRPHNGYVRLSFAVPEGFENSTFEVTLALRNWSKMAGGVGADIAHKFTVELVEEIPGRGGGDGRKKTGAPGGGGIGRGSNAVLLWVNGTDHGWQPKDVGELECLPASQVAGLREEFVDLAELGEVEIDCITLNTDYQPLVAYLDGRAETIKDTDAVKNRYAVGVGVQMLVLAEEEDRLAKAGHNLDPEARIASHRAAARGVLAVLPEFDRLAQIVEEAE
jgi:hypothetical protein